MPRIYDVTVPLAPGMLTYAGDPPFEIEPIHKVGEAPFSRSRMVLTTHSGTHVDAPAHFLAGGATIDQLPLEILLGKARVVEISTRERVERGHLGALDLRDDLRVLLKTRMSGQMLKAGYQEDHLYLTVDAAHYLAQAGLKLVGFDYLSIDRFGSADFPAHHALRADGCASAPVRDRVRRLPGLLGLVRALGSRNVTRVETQGLELRPRLLFRPQHRSRASRAGAGGTRWPRAIDARQHDAAGPHAIPQGRDG